MLPAERTVMTASELTRCQTSMERSEKCSGPQDILKVEKEDLPIDACLSSLF
jgi:hypothetical protein